MLQAGDRNNPWHDGRLQGRGRILLVEDQAAVRSTLGLILFEAGYETLESSSIPEAIALLNEEHFLLIVTDSFGAHHDLTGPTAAVRRAAGKTPIVLCTAYPIDEDDARAAGFAAAIEKPFDIEEFIALISGLVG